MLFIDWHYFELVWFRWNSIVCKRQFQRSLRLSYHTDSQSSIDWKDSDIFANNYIYHKSDHRYYRWQSELVRRYLLIYGCIYSHCYRHGQNNANRFTCRGYPRVLVSAYFELYFYYYYFDYGVLSYRHQYVR